jgi:hypothetical protein
LILLLLSALSVPLLDAAFDRIYNGDPAGAQRMASEKLRNEPADLEARVALTASLYFGEMMRTGALGVDLGAKRQAGLAADAAVRRRVIAEAEAVRAQARARIEGNARDERALLSLMLVEGLERDYLALVEKEYRASWRSAERPQQYALRLLEVVPGHRDALFTIGFNEYIRLNVPLVLRPFLRLEGSVGDRREAIRNLEAAAREGRYLRGMARLMLVGIYAKQGRQQDAQRTVCHLKDAYPANASIRDMAAATACD